MQHKKSRKKVGRPREGKALKKQISARVDADIQKIIIKNHESIQKWIDGLIEKKLY